MRVKGDSFVLSQQSDFDQTLTDCRSTTRLNSVAHARRALALQRTAWSNKCYVWFCSMVSSGDWFCIQAFTELQCARIFTYVPSGSEWLCGLLELREGIGIETAQQCCGSCDRLEYERLPYILY